MFGKELAILSDGSVAFCHLDYDGLTTIGNAKTERLEKILGSREFTKTARTFKAGESVPQGCRLCKSLQDAGDA